MTYSHDKCEVNTSLLIPLHGRYGLQQNLLPEITFENLLQNATKKHLF